MLLAVENTEFELAVATHRKADARRRLNQAGLGTDLGLHPIERGISTTAPPLHVELLTGIEASLAQLRSLVLRGSQAQTGGDTRQAVAPPPRVGQSAKGASARDTRPTMLNLFEDLKLKLKLKQTRERSIAAVESVVMDFRKLHGPLAVEVITCGCRTVAALTMKSQGGTTGSFTLGAR